MDKVLLIGEPMELLLAEEEGALSDVTHFRASVSGAEMNVAVGLARLGLCPRFMTRLGSDPRAVRIRRFMNENGIADDLNHHRPGSSYRRNDEEQNRTRQARDLLFPPGFRCFVPLQSGH